MTDARFCRCGDRVVQGVLDGRQVTLDWRATDQGTVQAAQTAGGAWMVASAPPGTRLLPPWKRYAIHKCDDDATEPVTQLGEWKRAKAQQAAAQRRQRGRHRAASYRAGFNVRRPQ